MLPASPTPGSQAIHTGYRARTVLTLWRQLSTWGSQECELGSRLVDAGPCHLRHRLMGRSGLPSGTRAGAPSAGRGRVGAPSAGRGRVGAPSAGRGAGTPAAGGAECQHDASVLAGQREGAVAAGGHLAAGPRRESGTSVRSRGNPRRGDGSLGYENGSERYLLRHGRADDRCLLVTPACYPGCSGSVIPGPGSASTSIGLGARAVGIHNVKPG
jgi:hypothetical protein